MVIKVHKEKKHLSREEEFALFKLIFDKFLWIGTIGTVYGIYLLLERGSNTWHGITITLIGCLFFTILTSIVAKNYNYKKN